MSAKRSQERLFVPWLELAGSAAVLYLFVLLNPIFEFAAFTRGCIGIVCFFYFGGALGLLARNVFWFDRRDYHPLPRWAFLPFATLFGLLAGCVLVQLFGYFRLEDLGYVLFTAVIAAVGCGDVLRTYALRRAGAN